MKKNGGAFRTALLSALAALTAAAVSAQEAGAPRFTLPPSAEPADGAKIDLATGLPGQIVHIKTGITLVLIPAGEFLMGSPPEETDRFFDEGPRRRVRITRPFYMGKYEVTNAQFRKFDPAHKSGTFEDQTLSGPDQPAVYVIFNKADAFCKWAGLSLPTEAQWEYACRAGGTARFWWGDAEKDAGRYANVADQQADRNWQQRFIPVGFARFFPTDDGHVASAPVGSYEPNPFALHDMIGNAWEWCADRFDPYYYRTSPPTDPPGPDKGARRTLRGGGWISPPANARSATRYGDMPHIDNCAVGLRVVLNIAQ